MTTAYASDVEERRVPVDVVEAAGGQWHAMVDPDGIVFYPGGPEDAHLFAYWHEAVPLYGPRARRLFGGAAAHVLCGVEPCEDCSG